EDVLAHAGRRLRPRRTEPLLDVGLDLRTQAEHETALRVVLQVPPDVGHVHWAARERDGDARSQLDALGAPGGDHEGEERIVAGLGRPDAVVAGFLRLLG